MYGVEWLIVLAVAGLAVGGGIGYLMANRSGSGKRQLETELEAAREELTTYRQAVVTQYSETARRFQTLNDAYRDLHQHLARSSSELCGDITGPLLEGPPGEQHVIPADVRERVLTREAAAPEEAEGRAGDPYEDDEIRVAEPPAAMAAAAAPADAGATTGAPPAGEPETTADTAATDAAQDATGASQEEAPATETAAAGPATPRRDAASG